MRLTIAASLSTGVCLLSMFLGESLSTEKPGPVAWWSFNEGKGSSCLDAVRQVRDKISGNWWKFLPGADGSGLKFDGFTTAIGREAAKTPRLSEAFITVEAWVALAAYPWNWCPIVSQEKDQEKGYYFGIDSEGHFGLQLSVNGKWHTSRSESRLDLKKWYHVAGTYSPTQGMVLYLNGSRAGELLIQGKPDWAGDMDLWIGRNSKNKAPAHPVRTFATFPSPYSLDAILDEIKIHNRALSAAEVRDGFARTRPEAAPQMPPRVFPSEPGGTGRFGAFYTRLKYYEEWDALWRTGSHSDVVVRFDEHPIKLVFWRGTRYSPAWVTENGKWMADQSLETFTGPGKGSTIGCVEHMSDAQCRFSHVRIIENHDARIVVHWRYALLDVLYRHGHVDPNTGWGDWGDEYYTIYPDGAAVRNVHHWTSGGKTGWQETIFLNEPGTKPEDNCELKAITLANLEGQTKTYSWEHGYPKFDLEKALIQMTNLKAKYRPFMIFRPGSDFEVFNVEVRPELSKFPWWNHWPVAQIVSDGRYALAADHASHSSLSWGGPKDDVALYGMTNEPAGSLVPLAKSWIYPPTLRVIAGPFTSRGYDFSERAYLLSRSNSGSRIKLEVSASAESPLFNPCFVIQDWGDMSAGLRINGRGLPAGKNFRLGHHQRLEGTDLVIWFKTHSVEPLLIELEPVMR